MLFGEYSVVVGGKALGIIHPTLGGSFTFSPPHSPVKKQYSQASLQKILTYLQTLQTDNTTLTDFDISSFEQDLAQGIYFQSNVPEGCGLGSSAALVAAIYKRYAKKPLPISTAYLPAIQQQLGQIESYFHGKSSGFDPLISYVKQTVLVHNPKHITLEKTNEKEKLSYQLFLVNTNHPRKTAPLVLHFLASLKKPIFKELCETSLCTYNNNCIQSFLNQEEDGLLKNWQQLSSLQYHHFSFLIPDSFRPHWRHGLQSNDFYIKICGAGGGGYLLGITQKIEMVYNYFGKENILLI